MDSYIKSSKHASDPADNVWMKDAGLDKFDSHSAAPAKASIAETAPTDSAGEVPVFKPHNSMMFRAPEAPVARPFSAGGSSNQGGAVVDIKLDSELQESLLQSRQHGRGATAPNVEAAVASERMQDVYIHDDFGAAAAEDAKKEQEVNDSKNMKP